MDPMREKASGDDDQCRTGPAEEALQVKSRAKLEDCGANSNGKCEASDCAKYNPDSITGCGHRRSLSDQEERRLNAFPNHRRKGEAAESEEWCGDECLIDPLAQLTAHRDGLPPHPEEHPGDNGACQEHCQSFKGFFRIPFKRTKRHKDSNSDHGGGEHGKSNARPNDEESISTTDLDEIAGDDANDERSLNPFSESGEQAASEWSD
jgi:hypothetical protein